MTAGDDRIRSALARELGSARRDGALFAILTILLTPVFVVLAVIALVAMVAYVDLPVLDDVGYFSSFVTLLNTSLLWMFTALFLRPKCRASLADLVWVGAAVVVLAVILWVSYGTRLPEANPRVFWPAYGGLALLMLGLLGHAYEPRDSYYLGWFNGWMDDPFTLQDDVDRAHVGLGFAMAFPRLIVGSYAEIFGSGWLIRGLGGEELDAAANVLRALSEGRPEEAQRILRSRERSAARIVRVLAKLKLVESDRGRLRLISMGERLVGGR
ncbi:MAG: hypothetical protein HYY16_13670 [Planctomycetes bacterium]|nr:hypothetical protein [Planctomycetota bacterium]